MPEMSQKTWLLVVATLALIVAYLGFQLADRNTTIGLLNNDNAGLTLEKDPDFGLGEDALLLRHA